MSRPQRPHLIAAACSSPRTGRPASHFGHLARMCKVENERDQIRLKADPTMNKDHRPGKNDGSGRSRIVCSPGAAASTLGIELITIDVVAMSP